MRIRAGAIRAPTQLAQGFQVSADNPLIGLEGRAALLRSLGELRCQKSLDVFARQRYAPDLADYSIIWLRK